MPTVSWPKQRPPVWPGWEYCFLQCCMVRRQEKLFTGYSTRTFSRKDKSLAITWEPRAIYRVSWHCPAWCRVWNDTHLFWLIFCLASAAVGQSILEVLVSAVALLCPREGQRGFSVVTHLSSCYCLKNSQMGTVYFTLHSWPCNTMSIGDWEKWVSLLLVTQAAPPPASPFLILCCLLPC